MHYHTLPTNHPMPMLGLGTFDLKGEEGTRAIETALSTGYRHLDTALGYDNHDAVGRAIARSGLARSELFVTTKVPREQLGRQQVLDACQRSLEELGLDYLDLFLVHWPNNEIPLEETFGAFARLVEDGLVRHIGVSNFIRPRLQLACQVSPVPIAVNQVEYHPYLNQQPLLDLCRKQGVALTAYSPLAQGRLKGDPLLEEIARRHHRAPTQIALRWLLHKGIAAIPRSRSRAHQESNFDLFSWSLDEAEIERIDRIGKKLRVIDWWPGEFDKDDIP